MMVVLNRFESFSTEKDAFTSTIHNVFFVMLLAPMLRLLDMDIA